MFENLPPYDPGAARKEDALRAKFYALAEMYTNCAHPDRQDQKIHSSAMPWNEVSKHEGDIRRAFLASCQTLDDFKHRIYKTPAQDEVDEKIKGQLRDAYERRQRLPYRGERAQGPFSSLDDIGFVVWEYPDFFSQANRQKRTGSDVCQTIVTIDMAPDRINLCFTALPCNYIKAQIDYAADLFYTQMKNGMRKDAIEGRPVDVYMHVPVDASIHGRDEFYLVDSVHCGVPVISPLSKQRTEYPALVPMVQIPRVLDYIFYANRAEVSERLNPQDAQNDFRGFALRAM